MNHLILFSNIKGGVGKTTLCAHFCEYLTMKGYHVTAADADLQASLSRHRERELQESPGHPVPWEIVRLNTLDTETLKSDLKELRRNDGIVVIDCPGNLNDNNLSAIYARKMTSARLVFLPNRINTTEGKARELEMREETIAILGKLGAVTPRIKQSVVIKRYSTLQPLDKYQYAAVEHAFDRINDIIKNL